MSNSLLDLARIGTEYRETSSRFRGPRSVTRPLGKTVNLSEAALLGIPKLTLPESTRFDQRDSIRRASLSLSLFLRDARSTPVSPYSRRSTREETWSRRGRRTARTHTLQPRPGDLPMRIPRQPGGHDDIRGHCFAPSSLFVRPSRLGLRRTPSPERANARSSSIIHGHHRYFPPPSRDEPSRFNRPNSPRSRYFRGTFPLAIPFLFPETKLENPWSGTPPVEGWRGG